MLSNVIDKIFTRKINSFQELSDIKYIDHVIFNGERHDNLEIVRLQTFNLYGAYRIFTYIDESILNIDFWLKYKDTTYNNLLELPQDLNHEAAGFRRIVMDFKDLEIYVKRF
jgi:hypothetical protein